MPTKLSKEHLLALRVLSFSHSHLASRLKTCRRRASLVRHATARQVSNPSQHPWAPLVRAAAVQRGVPFLLLLLRLFRLLYELACEWCPLLGERNGSTRLIRNTDEQPAQSPALLDPIGHSHLHGLRQDSQHRDHARLA